MSPNVTELVAYVPPPSPEVDVYSVCSRIEAWAATADDVFMLKDNKAKLAAIDQYLAQTSKEGRNQIAATMRRLEVRIGEVLGPPEHGGDRRSADQVQRDELEISRAEKSDLRKMAAHSDVVEAVIASSTDENPASRRKVLEAIKEKENPPVTDTAEGLDRSPAAAALRAETAREMAAKGYTSKQIAERLGLSEQGMPHFRKKHGIDVPADAFAARSPKIDSNRVIDATVDSVRHINTGLNLVDWSALDIDNFDEWVRSLKAARRALYTLIDNLEKEKTRRGTE